mgnify:CR=1 FL=1
MPMRLLLRQGHEWSMEIPCATTTCSQPLSKTSQGDLHFHVGKMFPWNHNQNAFHVVCMQR